MICRKIHHTQGRTDARWRPGHKANLACSNLMAFGSQSTLLNKVLVTLLGLFGAPIVLRHLPLTTRYVPEHIWILAIDS